MLQVVFLLLDALGGQLPEMCDVYVEADLMLFAPMASQNQRLTGHPYVVMDFDICWTLWGDLVLKRSNQRFGISPTRLSLTKSLIWKIIDSDSLPTSVELEAFTKRHK